MGVSPAAAPSMVTYAQGVACTEMLPSPCRIADVAVGAAVEGVVGVAAAADGKAEDDGGCSVSIAPRSGESIGEGR